jgi:hypothetical protein
MRDSLRVPLALAEAFDATTDTRRIHGRSRLLVDAPAMLWW